MRFELPAEKKLIHEVTIPLRWGDMDAMGHINNTLYFRYMEILRIEWMHSLVGAHDPRGDGFVVANAFCNFLRQLEYPGDVLAKHYVCNPGRSSFETYVTLERTDTPGEVCASGGGKAVWVDFPRQRSLPLPDWVRAILV
jgi:acyl-CoA thioester hydrolase